MRGTIFAIGLPEIVKTNNNVRLLTADISSISGMDRFIKNHPEKFINVGIAEQNMVGVAAGLGMEGFCVFATTYASFTVVRALEQTREHLSYLKSNVKLVGSYAGVVASRAGISHWATEDLSFMRSLPNMIVVSPADSLEAYKAAVELSKIDLPAYIRLTGNLNCPMVHNDDIDFELGKAIKIKEGKKVAILATGLMVNESKIAITELEDKYDISCSLYSFHTIKPIDKKELSKIFKNYELIVTVEEHTIFGGLGTAVAEYKASFNYSPKQIFIGFPDKFDIKFGSQEYIWNQMGIDSKSIIKKIKNEYS